MVSFLPSPNVTSQVTLTDWRVFACYRPIFYVLVCVGKTIYRTHTHSVQTQTAFALVNIFHAIRYKQMNGGRNKSAGIPQCQDSVSVCVCVRAHSGLLLHARTRSCEHAAYDLSSLPLQWVLCLMFFCHICHLAPSIRT
jgi:hypothetical protein